MKSLADKLKYNEGRNEAFSIGYDIGVNMYRKYGLLDKRQKEQQKEYIDECSQRARAGDALYKGVMCGIRDAANERKANKK